MSPFATHDEWYFNLRTGDDALANEETVHDGTRTSPILESLAAATGGRAFDEADLTGAERQVHADLGSGKAEAVASERGHRLPLAPYLAAVAILPLGVLLWRRDR